MTSAISLLVVDDHPLFVDGFSSVLAAARPRWSLAKADGIASATRLVEDGAPFSLALVDIRLKDGDGIDLVGRLAQMRPGLPVLVISGHDNERMAARALQAGARGFITKTEPAEVLLDLIDRLLVGEDRHIVGLAPAGDIPALTERQRQVLDLLAQGCANKEIRHQLGIAERTVRAHLTELFGQLNVNGRVQALLRAQELGLIK